MVYRIAYHLLNNHNFRKNIWNNIDTYSISIYNISFMFDNDRFVRYNIFCKYELQLMNRRVVNLSTSKKVSKVQEALSQYIGSDVKLKANSGRRKFIERTGVLEGTYSNLFVVRVEEKSVERKMSFSYADLLTGNVVLVIHRDGKDYRLVVNQN